jgi:ribosomal protein L34E
MISTTVIGHWSTTGTKYTKCGRCLRPLNNQTVTKLKMQHSPSPIWTGWLCKSCVKELGG